jgi:hypothetical protein
MFSAYGLMLRGLNLTHTLPETFLGDLTTLLSESMPWFSHKKVAFLVDDFSTHRLREGVQMVLNRVIWERRPSHVFKVSSEKYGAVLTDPFNATIDVTREMIEVDCGKEYLALDDSVNRRRAYSFAVELLDNRLRLAGYVGKAEQIIGPSMWTEGSLEKALRNLPPGRSHSHYHGLDCIADLCSGDVSTLLEVYRRIFENGRVSRSTTERVAPSIQNDSIVFVSREMLEAVKSHHPHGLDLYRMATEFGGLTHKILVEGREIKNGPGSVPAMCPRIEIDQLNGSAAEALTAAQQDLAKELVRRAIFIEMDPGRSRHGNATTLRWHFRRVYLPAFNSALKKNVAVKETPP